MPHRGIGAGPGESMGSTCEICRIADERGISWSNVVRMSDGKACRGREAV